MPDLPADYFNRPLAEVDPEIAEAVGHELVGVLRFDTCTDTVYGVK